LGKLTIRQRQPRQDDPIFGKLHIVAISDINAPIGDDSEQAEVDGQRLREESSRQTEQEAR
jgi:hypothetical protein